MKQPVLTPHERLPVKAKDTEAIALNESTTARTVLISDLADRPLIATFDQPVCMTNSKFLSTLWIVLAC